MINKKSLHIEIFHCIAWMFYHRNLSHKYRAEIDAGSLIFPDFVYPESTCTSPDEGVEDGAGKIINDLKIVETNDESYDHTVSFKFTFKERTLREHLKNRNDLHRLNFDETLKVFLVDASKFGSHFESMKDGFSVVESLPISMSKFSVPEHFRKCLDALSNSEFAKIESNYCEWSAPIKPYMESAGLWIGDQTVHQVREADLIHIWDTMPPRMKAPFLDHAKKVNGLDVLSYAMVMGHCWYDGKWHNEPKDLENLKRGGLRGGHIPTAKELGKLFKKGKIGV